MASNAAVPFWRSAGMTYITYSNICANLVRNCLKEPHKSEAISREKVHFSVSKKAKEFFYLHRLFSALAFGRDFAETKAYRASYVSLGAIDDVCLPSARILLRNDAGCCLHVLFFIFTKLSMNLISDWF
ncbi:ATPase, F1 complex, epsilon subunit, mitochondrial [Cynara cardunculus var. scolymus]|uniref:ATP synthase subunit epsilon, mitochondrial n=1 Tax=Cynara cardunculus var. scolymus TaxID=59895 RepID=A0A103YB23_CYNCS|nr:ATPase, F1 complex, epsilon subunit, mitochondrial [Cynara cardunculus var. scolymus]